MDRQITFKPFPGSSRNGQHDIYFHVKCNSLIRPSSWYKVGGLTLHIEPLAMKILVGSILRNGTERNGTERNDGLNCGTECFLRLKLAAYHCCTSYQWHFQQVIKRYPKKDKTNLRIDCGFLLVVISNEVLIVGIADSVCSSSDISSRKLNA